MGDRPRQAPSFALSLDRAMRVARDEMHRTAAKPGGERDAELGFGVGFY
jgi:hypothetical protein